MSFQPSSSSLFDMIPGSPGYTGFVEACARQKATLLQDRKHQTKWSTITTGYKERILADPGVLPVENHEEGGFSEYIVFCAPCNNGVILGSAWNLGNWSTHSYSQGHVESVRRWEACHGPLGNLVKDAMPRYKAVWRTAENGYSPLAVEVYVPTPGSMVSPYNDLVPISFN
ncbi:hypothetical protein DFP72DRAFT_1083028 [Ephemerocybe angulata]|uniref:Uncharacterized protein n=1 Tax=Ephemerocybe angulata TaxID=980116 RepID=A0A8H6H7H1_9AGAR|nr:hypothetical protein DFP72DRAFT_1083028 [Tulosesus angulatus]